MLEEDSWKPLVEEAVRIATLNLKAEACPAGTMDVVLGCGWPGILLHEAIGHGLEGDFNRKGTSAFSGRLGQRLAMWFGEESAFDVLGPSVRKADQATLDELDSLLEGENWWRLPDATEDL